jgi:hypothetical protein
MFRRNAMPSAGLRPAEHVSAVFRNRELTRLAPFGPLDTLLKARTYRVHQYPKTVPQK